MYFFMSIGIFKGFDVTNSSSNRTVLSVFDNLQANQEKTLIAAKDAD